MRFEKRFNFSINQSSSPELQECRENDDDREPDDRAVY